MEDKLTVISVSNRVDRKTGQGYLSTRSNEELRK